MITIELNESIPGKVRPRVTKSHTYIPKSYRDWQERFSKLLPIPPVPHKAICIAVIFYGKHRSDPDNMIGTILDTLVKYKYVENDKLINVPSAKWYSSLVRYSNTKGPVYAKIVLTPLDDIF